MLGVLTVPVVFKVTFVLSNPITGSLKTTVNETVSSFVIKLLPFVTVLRVID